MKKTLLICGIYPLPVSTGSTIRTMNFVRYFKQLGSVDIAYSELQPGSEAGDPIFSNEYVLEMKDYPQGFIGRLEEAFKGRPFPIHAYTDNSQRMLLSVIRSNHYDYILARYTRYAFCLFKLPKKQKNRVIVDFDDVLSGSLYETLFSRSDNPLKKIFRKANLKLLENYEKKCLDLNVSLFCSEADRKKTIIDGNNAMVVPNIFINSTFEKYDFGTGLQSGNTLLFIGTLGYLPNIEGLKWFIETIFPEFKREYRDAKLLVVGLAPGKEVTKLCQETEGVELHANVPDVKEYYKRCKAVVVPLLSGGGTRIKILEAALTNRPVLATPVGAEGLDLVHGRDVLLFLNAEEFSLGYQEILNGEKYKSLARNAREFVLKSYSTENFDKAMDNVVKRIDRDM